MIASLVVAAVLAAPPGSEILIDVPPECRQPNWEFNEQGSCVNASVITLLRARGHDQIADWWRENHGGSETSTSILAKLDAAGIKYAVTRGGDVGLLEYASRNRLGAVLFYTNRRRYPVGYHAVNLVDFNDSFAVLVDNNRPLEFDTIPRDQFIAEWLADSGFALVLLYPPPPPWPAAGQT